MLRRLVLAALIALAPSIGQAQFATIGATPAVTDISDKLANTQWVNNLIANGLTLASGKVWIGSAGNVATPQTPSGDCTLSLSGVITCTQSAGAFTVNGLLTVTGNLSVGGSIIDGNGILATNIVAPATPAAGTTRIYVDSTTKVLTFKNDAGTLGNGVVPSTCGANLFGTSISAGGVFGCTQPSFANLSGSLAASQMPALTGDVTTSAGTVATAIGANKVTRAMQAQGIARSVIGVTGNATANVADIQGAASQFFGVNSAGTALAFQTMSGDATLSGPAITVTKVNGVDQTTAWTTYTPTGTATTPGGTPPTITCTGRSKTLGKTVFLEQDCTITAAGTGTGNLLITLPATAAAANYVGVAREHLNTGHSGAALIASGGTQTISTEAAGATFIATGNLVAVGITYEIP